MSITVFLADDHTVVRDGLRAFLGAQGDIEVVGAAGDGREALRRVEDLAPDVAVVDIAMPELNGIEVTRRIRESSPETEVVILSMHSNMGYVLRALRAGARGFMIKESAAEEVVEAVRSVHQGRRYLSRKIADEMIDGYIEQQEVKEEPPLARLTPREREVARLVAEGESSSEIAEKLSLSRTTVNTYRSRAMGKLGVDNVPDLVKLAVRHGLIPLE